MKDKSKNKVSKQNIILTLIGISVILLSAYNIISLSLQEGSKKSQFTKLENKYYVVGKDPSDYQKEVFSELSKELEESNVNYKKVSELVAESFVIDFFTWTNKDSTYDIGGLQYVLDKNTFYKEAKWNYYQKLDVYKESYAKDQLPIVVSVNKNSEKIEDYLIEEKNYPAYKVDLNWKYGEDVSSKFKNLINDCEITLIEDNGKIVIVEVLMMDEVSQDE